MYTRVYQEGRYSSVKKKMDIKYSDFISVQVSKAMWGKTKMKTMTKFYPKDGIYVFSRDMHSGNQYYAYQKANKGKESSESVTLPAFPTYLFPPEDVIRKMEVSPKLTLKTHGIRVDNWKSIYGEYVCCDKDFDKYEVTLTRKERSGYWRSVDDVTIEKKLIEYLKENGKERKVYSFYDIKRLTNKKGKVTMFEVKYIGDITKKYNGIWSKKSSYYSSSISRYYFTTTKYGPMSGYDITDLLELVQLLVKTDEDTEKSTEEDTSGHETDELSDDD